MVIDGNGLGDLGVSGGEETIISVSIVESNDNSGIDLSVLRFLDEVSIPTSTIDGFFNFSSSCGIFITRFLISVLFSEFRSEFKGKSLSNSVPEEISSSQFFPKIASLGLP